MAKVNTPGSSGSGRRMKPALTPEARESQMGYLAMELAEKQLRDGTASSQVITHFLKIVSSKERLEKERLEEENKLLRAKTKSLSDSADSKALYENAIKAFRSYSGIGVGEEDEGYED